MQNDATKTAKSQPRDEQLSLEPKPQRFRLRTGLKAGEASSEKIKRF